MKVTRDTHDRTGFRSTMLPIVANCMVRTRQAGSSIVMYKYLNPSTKVYRNCRQYATNSGTW